MRLAIVKVLVLGLVGDGGQSQTAADLILPEHLQLLLEVGGIVMELHLGGTKARMVAGDVFLLREGGGVEMVDFAAGKDVLLVLQGPAHLGLALQDLAIIKTFS